MKILLIGKNGLLGSEVEKELERLKLNFIAYDRDDIDLTKIKNIPSVIEKTNPTIIINTAGYTAVDKGETEKDLTNLVNGYCVGALAKTASELNIPLIHISTDYVFDGKKKTGYNEEDKTNPINIYGKSKELGEKLLMKLLPKKYCLIRTSWLYGKKGTNFVDTIINLSKSKKELKVINDQTGSPTYANDLAKEIVKLAINPKFGIFHITNLGKTNWYEFAKEILKIKNIPTKIIPIKSKNYNVPAKRPKYSMLNNNKLPKMRRWDLALKDFLSL